MSCVDKREKKIPKIQCYFIYMMNRLGKIVQDMLYVIFFLRNYLILI